MDEAKLDHLNDAVREEYGEPDRPLPSDFIQEIDGKFVEWDTYKMMTIKNQQSAMKDHILKNL